MATPTRCTILWNNIADTKTYSIYSDGDSDYPATNLHDNDIHTVARTASASAARYFMVDMGGSTSYDMIAIAGCNASRAVAMYAGSGAGSDPTAFANYAAMTFSSVTDCGVYYWSTTQTTRYVAVRFTNTNLSYCQIGELWIGMKMQFHVNPQIPIELIRNVETTELITGGGQRWSYENYKQRGYGLNFKEDFSPSGAGSFASLDDMYYNLGNSLPFFFHLLPTDTNDPPLFVHNVSYDFSIDGKDKRPGRWTVEEEI
jgi:hypothetical protein